MFSDRKTNVSILIASGFFLLVMAEAFRQATSTSLSAFNLMFAYAPLTTGVGLLCLATWFQREIRVAVPRILFISKLFAFVFVYVTMCAAPYIPWTAFMYGIPMAGVVIELNGWILALILIAIGVLSYNMSRLFKWFPLQLVMFPIVNGALSLMSIWAFIYAVDVAR